MASNLEQTFRRGTDHRKIAVAQDWLDTHRPLRCIRALCPPRLETDSGSPPRYRSNLAAGAGALASTPHVVGIDQASIHIRAPRRARHDSKRVHGPMRLEYETRVRLPGRRSAEP